MNYVAGIATGFLLTLVVIVMFAVGVSKGVEAGEARCSRQETTK